MLIASACSGARNLRWAPTPHIEWSVSVQGARDTHAAHGGGRATIDRQVHHLVKGHQFYRVKLTVVDGLGANGK